MLVPFFLVFWKDQYSGLRLAAFTIPLFISIFPILNLLSTCTSLLINNFRFCKSTSFNLLYQINHVYMYICMYIFSLPFSVILVIVLSPDHLDALLRHLKEQSLAHQKFVWVLNISRNAYKKLSLARWVMISSEMLSLCIFLFIRSFTHIMFSFSDLYQASNQERF